MYIGAIYVDIKILIIMAILVAILFLPNHRTNLTATQKNFRKKMNQLKKEGKVLDQYGQKIEPTKKTFNFPIKSLLFAFFIIVSLFLKFDSIRMRLNNITNTFNNTPTSNINLTQKANSLFVSQQEVSNYIHSLDAIDQLSNDTQEMINKYLREEHTYTEQEITEVRNRITNARQLVSSTNSIYKNTNNLYSEIINVSETQVNFIDKYKNIKPTYEISQEIKYTYNLYVANRNKTRTEVFNLLKSSGMRPTMLDDGTIHYYIDNTYY